MFKRFAAFVLVLFSLSSILFIGSPAFAQSSGGNISVQPTTQQSTANKLADRASNSWPWYITRASGLVAAASLVILLLSGIGQITGYSFRFLEPITAWATHRALGIAFGVSVLVHVFSLLFDKFISFNFFQLLIPFISDYRRVVIGGVHLGSLYVALGILAFYATLVVVLSSLLWVDKRQGLWRLLHYLSYFIIVFIFIHALYLGTDLAHGIFRLLWILAGISIALAVLTRLRRARTT